MKPKNQNQNEHLRDAREFNLSVWAIFIAAMLYSINYFVEYDKFNIAAIAVTICCCAYILVTLFTTNKN